MNKLLINEYPLVVLPGLAKEIGLNEAILLQQIHFWISKNTHVKDGVSWVYNTYAGWVHQFPFWSESTIKRAIKSLEKQNLLIIGNFNKLKIDNTKWYSINYEELNLVTRPSGQNDLTDGSEWTGASGQNDPTITIDHSETTTETTNRSIPSQTKQTKNLFLDFVELTDDEHKKIIERFGKPNADELIERLNNYVGSTGKKYKSHYFTLLNWAKRDHLGKETKHERTKEHPGGYDPAELDEISL